MQLRKRGGVWQAIYYDASNTRRFRSTHCTDKRAAESAARRFERQAQGPDSVAAEDPTTVGDLCEDLIDHMTELVRTGRRAPDTLDYYRDKTGSLLLALEIDEHGDRVPLRATRLSPPSIDAMISKRRADGATENTIAKELGALRLALKLGARAGKYHGDLAALFPPRFSPEYKPGDRWLTPEELEALLGHLPRDHAARVAFAVATSANRRETWLAQRADVNDHAVLVRGTKRESRLRTVPLVLPWQCQLVTYALEHAEGIKGKLFRFDGGFRRALDAACIDSQIPHCSSNDLRRTFCHWMRQDGVPRELVAAAMGHVGTMMVDKVYGRLDAAELGALMARSVSGTPVAQTPADSADSLDSADSKRRRKRAKLVPEEGIEPTSPFGQRILRTLRDLPEPREYRKQRPDTPSVTGTVVAQVIAVVWGRP